ncbi:MAG: acetyltransferase [Bacteroidota bacterium]
MEQELLTARKFCIIGYSGHAFIVIEALLAQGLQVAGYCDASKKSLNPYDLDYLGSEQDLTVSDYLKQEDYSCFIAIGNNQVRQRVFENIINRHLQVASIIHPSAIVSATAVIEEGTLVSASAIIQAQAKIGKAVICNTASVIEHECQVGDFAHIGPGAVLCGNVSVGEGSFVGAGAVINPGVTIGRNVVIGSGSVVIKDVANNCLVAGNPAREIKKIL